MSDRGKREVQNNNLESTQFRVLFCLWISLFLMVMSPISASGASFDMNNIRHVVITYQENHSFDSCYGGWEGVNE